MINRVLHSFKKAIENLSSDIWKLFNLRVYITLKYIRYPGGIRETRQP